MCGCSNNTNFSNYHQPSNRQAQVPSPSDCSITKQMLIKWKAMLNCVKINKKLDLIGLNEVTVNQYLGVIQSALNYPDNYCYYKIQLENFQTINLPLIIEYVSECNI